MTIPDFWIGFAAGMITMFCFLAVYGVFLYRMGYRTKKDDLTEFIK